MTPQSKPPIPRVEGTIDTLQVMVGQGGEVKVARPSTRRLDRRDDESIDDRTIPLYRLHGVDQGDDLVVRLRERRSAFTDGVPRFQAGNVIGEGSQGLIMRVHDRDCRRDVALKTLHHAGCDLDEISRFIHEAQVTAQLEHPGIVPVHDVGVLADGTVFYTMKRIEGVNLADHLAERAGKPELRFELLELFLRACEAIAFAHSRGVIHRDIKPRNIMVGPFGEVLVLDWGLAKIVGMPASAKDRIRSRDLPDSDGDVHRTMEGYAVGTPAYMSPEQARGSHQVIIDQRCDVYSLGVILYEMLCGVSPYQRGNVRKTLEQVARGEWKPLDRQETATSVSRRLVAIVHKAMAVEVARRYQSVPELIDDLRNYLSGRPVGAYRETPLEIALRQLNNHRLLVSAVAGTALVAGLLFGVWRWRTYAADEAQIQGWINEARHRLDDGDAFLGKSRTDSESVRCHELRIQAQQAYEVARRTYEGILKVREGYPGVSARLEDIKTRLGELEEADQADRRKGEVKAYAEKAVAFWNLARKIEQEALARSKGTMSMVVLTEAEHLECETNLVKAAGEYKSALGIKPNDPDLMKHYSDILTLRGQHEEARRSSAIAAARDEEKAHEKGNQADMLLKESDLALKEVEKLVEERCQASPAAIAAIDGQIQTKQERTLALLQGAILMRPRQEDMHRQDEISERFKAWRKAKTDQQRRDDAESLFTDVRTAAAADKPDEATALLARVQELCPDQVRLDEGNRLIAEARRRLNEEAARTILADVEVRQANADQERTELDQVLAQVEGGRARLEDGDAASLAHLYTLEQRAEKLGGHVARDLADIITRLLKADVRAPHFAPVRQKLAAYYVARLKEAEREGRATDAAVDEAMARQYDDGRYTDIIQGLATISCAAGSLPVTLKPIARKDDRTDRADDRIVLSLEPGKESPIPAGRYLVESAASSGVMVAQAREFHRGQHDTIALRAAPPLPLGMVYIPAGRIRSGSGRGASERAVGAFAIGRWEVTCGDYLAFLNDPATLRRYDEERAKGILRFAPRNSFDSIDPLWHQQAVPVWVKHPGEFSLSFRDRDGKETIIDAHRPVTGISWNDAQDYLAWLRYRDRLEWRLPTAAEWMLAAQGGDGRTYPWGNAFDPNGCASGYDLQRWMKDLKAGAVATDCSVQQVFDLAGSVSEFCADVTGSSVRQGESLYTMMGGNYFDRLPERFRTTSNRACDRRMVYSACGFRVALSVP